MTSYITKWALLVLYNLWCHTLFEKPKYSHKITFPRDWSFYSLIKCYWRSTVKLHYLLLFKNYSHVFQTPGNNRLNWESDCSRVYPLYYRCTIDNGQQMEQNQCTYQCTERFQYGSHLQQIKNHMYSNCSAGQRKKVLCYWSVYGTVWTN